MPSLTIAIPAYNEAANIRQLLESVARQVFAATVQLDRVLLISDGSSDKTVQIALATNISQLEVIDDAQRLGLAKRLDQICRESKTDLLIILNADVILPEKNTLQHLVSPLLAGRADLTSCRILAEAPQNAVEEILETSMRIKNRIFDSYKNGNNVFTCHGPARGFTRQLYSQLRFPHSVGEDAYSYLFAIHRGFMYEYVPQAFVKYGLPTSLKDHQQQSQRYQQSKQMYFQEFSTEFVKNQYHLPLQLLWKETLSELTRSPLRVIMYGLLYLILRVRGFFLSPVSEKWEIAASSKRGLST